MRPDWSYCRLTDIPSLEVVIHLLSHAAIHGLVAIRANALWGNRPWIRWTLLSSWVVYVCMAMAIGLAAVIENMRQYRTDRGLLAR